MKPFAAPSIVIEAPDDWADVTTYALLGPAAGEAHVTMVVSIARKIPESSLSAHVDRQIPDLKKFPKFSLERRQPTNIKAFDAVILEFKWKQPAGPMLRQRQYYIWTGGGTVYTLTGTAPDAAFAPWADVFDAMLKTFAPKKW